MKEYLKHIAMHVGIMVLILTTFFCICFFLGGCKTQYLTVPEYHNVYQTDTLTLHDSIMIHVRETVKGDVVYRDSIVYRDRWRDRIVEKQVLDSVPYPVEVVKEVHTRSGYDKFVSWGFWSLLLLILLAIGWRVVKAVYLRR